MLLVIYFFKNYLFLLNSMIFIIQGDYKMNHSFFLLTAILLALTSFGFTFDRSVTQIIQTQMTQDLEFIETIQSQTQSDLHKQIFGPSDGKAYSQFFNSRITSIGMNNCGNANAVACVIPFRDSSKMWLTANYVKFSHPQIARLMVVFHESRHTEDNHGNWPHANCPKPFEDPQNQPMKSIWTGSELAGEPACDETPFGSYGSSLIMLKNISKYCTNCTEKVKMDAGIYADDQVKRIIDPTAIQQIYDDLYRT